MAYNTVTYYLREAKLGTAEVTRDPEPSSPHITLTIPTGRSWQHWKKRKAVSSVRELVRATHIPRAHVIIYGGLTKSLEFARRLLRWVPQLVPDAQKARRVELACFPADARGTGTESLA
jgi:hypothetical protein